MVKIFKNPLIYIFVVAVFFRLYKLDSFPVGFHVDEVKVGWNALSILKTGVDDHLKRFSLYYDSFGDFRPSGIFYFTIPSLLIFGRSIFAVRFTTALFGAFSIFPIYFLVNEFETKTKKTVGTGYFAAILVAISPWHIELSRATDEVVLSTFFALFSLFFLISLIKKGKIIFALLTISSCIVSYLLYHPIRFLGPIFFAIIIINFYKKTLKKKIRNLIFICLTFVVALSVFFSTTKEGVARFNQVSIFKSIDTSYEIQRVRSEDLKKNLSTILFDNKEVIYFKKIIIEYLKYFSSDFLIGYSAKPYRFTTPGTGLLTYTELLLLTIGLVEIVKGKRPLLPLLLMIIAPLPAAVTIEDSPNISRAFFMLPFILIIESYGLSALINLKVKHKRIILTSISLLLIVNLAYFINMYFNHADDHKPYIQDFFVDSPTHRDTGATELSQTLEDIKHKYTRIVVTNFPDNIYPWYAFLNGKDPKEFNATFRNFTNERDYGNIVFSDQKCPADNGLLEYRNENALFIENWECPYLNQIHDKYPLKIIDTIKRIDGSIVYVLLVRDFSKPLIINGVTY